MFNKQLFASKYSGFVTQLMFRVLLQLFLPWRLELSVDALFEENEAWDSSRQRWSSQIWQDDAVQLMIVAVADASLVDAA